MKLTTLPLLPQQVTPVSNFRLQDAVSMGKVIMLLNYFSSIYQPHQLLGMLMDRKLYASRIDYLMAKLLILEALIEKQNLLHSEELEKKNKYFEAQCELFERKIDAQNKKLDIVMKEHADLKNKIDIVVSQQGQQVELRTSLDELKADVSALQFDFKFNKTISGLHYCFKLFAELYLPGEDKWKVRIDRFIQSKDPNMFFVPLSFPDFVKLWYFYKQYGVVCRTHTPRTNPKVILEHEWTTMYQSFLNWARANQI